MCQTYPSPHVGNQGGDVSDLRLGIRVGVMPPDLGSRNKANGLERIFRYAELVGRENVIAGVDCGFATLVGTPMVVPTIAWAKLGTLAEGARLAGRKL